MKKSTVLLSIAAMSALTASAIAPEAASLKVADANLGAIQTTASINKVEFNKVRKAPAKIASASDVYGNYEFNCVAFMGEWTTTSLSPTIVPAETGGNDVLIYNLPFSDLGLKGTVKPAENVLTIYSTDSGVYNDTYGENQILSPYQWTPTEDGGGTWKKLESLDLTINGDGSISFPIINDLPTGVCYCISKGFFYAFEQGDLVPIYLNMNLNLADWVDGGKGIFTESVLNTLFAASGMPEVEPYEVDLLVHKDNPAKYLIVDPYKGTRFDVSDELYNGTPEAKGYILVDATDPQCVIVEPLIGAGMDLVMMGQNGWEDNGELSIFNMEGLYIRDGYTTEEIFDLYDADDEYCSFMEGNDIYLMHIRFGFTNSPLAGYTWKDVTMQESQLTLDPAGVEGIQDDSNAPVKFYNLQGVEIANPEKGQLVIKKQGSKAQKMIVK